MLIILAVFLLSFGYYEFVIDPLYKMSKKSTTQVIAKDKDLLIIKTKVSSLNVHRKKLMHLTNIIQIANKSSLMPFVDVPLETKIKAIMGAAENSFVKIRSIKPMNFTEETKDGKTRIIKDKFFSIEGTATIEKLMKFLRNLWGTKLDSINVSSMNDVGTELRYFIKIEFLAKIDFSLIDSGKDTRIYENFNLKHNPFTIIKPPPPPKPKIVKKTINKPEKIVHTLDNFELIGIAKFNKESMAIINDQIKKRVIYLSKNDSFRKSVVKSIKETSVSFYFTDNKQTITVKLKTKTLELKTGTSKKKNNNKKKGHLGIMVETFTQDLANKYKLSFNPGLFVISPGRHRKVFKKNDIIIEINDQAVPNFEAALRIMNKIYAGDKIKIILKRDGKEMNFSYNAD